MKFKRTGWMEMRPPPFHDGEYEVRLADNGGIIKVMCINRRWVGDAVDFLEWRGLRLDGIERHHPHRRAMADYRVQNNQTYSAALDGALFLARRAVSINSRSNGYRYYLIARAISPNRLAEVDSGWMRRFVASQPPAKIQTEQRKADLFFEQRGGRPPTVD